MGRKVLFIGVQPEEVRGILTEFRDARDAILLRRNLREAKPDLSRKGTVSLVFTQPGYLRSSGGHTKFRRSQQPKTPPQTFWTNAPVPEIIGKSAAIREICRLIGRAVRTDLPVLCQGSIGVGKTLAAHATHFYSRRSGLPLFMIDCASTYPALVESEIFGHVEGILAGSPCGNPGALAAAKGGSLILANIEALSKACQARLFQALKTQKFSRTGSAKTLSINARVIATTRINLSKAVTRNEFLESLHRLLRKRSIPIPELRRRKEDVPLLVRHFVKRHARLNRRIHGVSEEAMLKIQEYDWPGNVRQLENCIQQALIVETQNFIRASSLALPENHKNPDLF